MEVSATSHRSKGRSTDGADERAEASCSGHTVSLESAILFNFWSQTRCAYSSTCINQGFPLQGIIQRPRPVNGLLACEDESANLRVETWGLQCWQTSLAMVQGVLT